MNQDRSVHRERRREEARQRAAAGRTRKAETEYFVPGSSSEEEAFSEDMTDDPFGVAPEENAADGDPFGLSGI